MDRPIDNDPNVIGFCRGVATVRARSRVGSRNRLL
jgi:hypothetical protein